MRRKLFIALTLLMAVAMQAQASNDTTTINIPTYVAQWNANNPTNPWPEGNVDTLRFAVDGKTVVAINDPGGEQMYFTEGQVVLTERCTLTITAPHEINKIILTFGNSWGANEWLTWGDRPTTCSSGQLQLGTSNNGEQSVAVWSGNAAIVEFITGYRAPLWQLAIICGTDDNTTPLDPDDNTTPTDQGNYLTMPDAQALYDFNGDGHKQIAQQFNNIVYIEDVNRDGILDFTTCSNRSDVISNTQLWLSSGASYIKTDSAFAVTNMDINRDGRVDYFIFGNGGPLGAAYGTIAYQTADGAFSMSPMEFINSQANHVNARRSPSISHQLGAPTNAIDLNNDGLIDLVDEKDGVLYINRGNGQWEWKELGYTLMPADLNGDGYMDFVMTGDALYSAIYNVSTQDYSITSIYRSGMVDDVVYCKDFDGDGDVDMLVTLSAVYNGGVSYTAFFMNNGQGTFTKRNEQNYGYDNKLWFSACQDVDGDGYYDLLAFRGDITYYKPDPWHEAYQALYVTAPEVVLLRGTSSNTFAAPEKLYDSNFGGGSWAGDAYLWTQGSNTPSDYPRNAMRLHIQAEDLDANGSMSVWATGGTNTGDTTVLFPVSAVTTNARPTAPAAPQLTYNNGLLTVTWGNGADDKTTTTDLTYALRIGTTAGGNDILAAHANADGTRRNFLDGNMGRAHTYTIDLRTYAPGTIYVAVQTIDAQHAGSVWSQEASIAHTYVPVEFSLSKDKIAFGDTVEVHYTALPEGYTHTWRYADGQVVKDTTYLVLTFPTGGRKTITHVVTAPNGVQDSVSAELIVLSAALGEATTITDPASTILQVPLADYTFDGRMDGIWKENYTMTVYEGYSSTLFRQALGMWNSNILSSEESVNNPSHIRWYDYDRDGNVDLLFRTSKNTYGKLLHEPWSATLTERVDDPNLVMIFNWYKWGGGYADYYHTLNEDMRHTGSLECVMMTTSSSGTTLQIIYPGDDGAAVTKDFTVIGDASQFNSLVEDESVFLTADFDHDGFADIAGIGNTTYSDRTFPELILYYNRGNGVYEQSNIPFPEDLPPFTEGRLADFNGDGYMDVLVTHTNYWDTQNDTNFGAIMWNNGNQSFTRQDLPLSNSIPTYAPGESSFIITDIDNNGYADVTAIRYDESKNAYSIYAWYMDGAGLMSHGYLVEGVANELHDIYLTSEDHRLLTRDADYNSLLYPIIAQADTRPAAPTNIQATMTDEGLLLTWDAALDDHTPAALMRYNLSVKMQGSDTYLFSPQNGGNENAAYLPGYNYINATRFLIPTSVLSNGNYEIRLQAVDNQNKMSLFSETFIKAVERNPIEAPSKACAWDYTTIAYQGADQTSTPIWDFDGAVIESGSSFGPYTIYWQTGGEKTITLTLTDTTYTATVTVSDPYELPIYPPQELYENVSATVSLPVGVTCEWYAKINDDTEWHSVTASGVYYLAGQFISYDRRLKAEGATITAYTVDGKTSLCDETVYLRFLFNTPEGCTGYYDYAVTVRPQTNIPTLSLVTTNAEGHNVISWTNVDAFTTINVYKEGNSLNDFQLIGSAAASAGTFTDANSDATQRAERYCVTGLSAQGESPASTIHQTVHLTINRGVTDGTYNLIWNNYSGATVTGYNILRGATPTSLSQIATLASSNTSYTDQAPEDAQPYYAIEYVLSTAANAPAKFKAGTKAAPLSGRSNVVNRQEIDNPAKYYTIRFLNYDNTELQSSQVKEGTMPSYTGATPTRPEDAQYTYTFSGWNPTIAAATSDADYTAQYTATEKQPQNYIPQNLVIVYNNSTSTGAALLMQWDAVPGALMYEMLVKKGDEDIVNVNTGANTFYQLNLTRKELPAGEHTLSWQVRAINSSYEPMDDYAHGTPFIVTIPAGQDIDNVQAADAPQKVLIDNQIYILRGNRIYTLTGQQVK